MGEKLFNLKAFGPATEHKEKNVLYIFYNMSKAILVQPMGNYTRPNATSLTAIVGLLACSKTHTGAQIKRLGESKAFIWSG